VVVLGLVVAGADAVVGLRHAIHQPARQDDSFADDAAGHPVVLFGVVAVVVEHLGGASRRWGGGERGGQKFHRQRRRGGHVLAERRAADGHGHGVAVLASPARG
jgi:hypothetical protein